MHINAEKWYRWTYFQGRNGDADIKRMDLWAQDGEGEREPNWETSINIYTLSCVKQIASGKMLCSTELSLVLCDDLEAWDVGWGVRREGGPRGRGYMYTYSWFISLCRGNQSKFVKQLYPNWESGVIIEGSVFGWFKFWKDARDWPFWRVKNYIPRLCNFRLQDCSPPSKQKWDAEMTSYIIRPEESK